MLVKIQNLLFTTKTKIWIMGLMVGDFDEWCQIFVKHCPGNGR